MKEENKIQADPKLVPAFQKALDNAVYLLTKRLEDNLYSLILYGSAVRGDLDVGISDLNLLVVLERSTADSHRVIGEITGERVVIDPMVVEHAALSRVFRVFALKFMSIRRNHRVLHGASIFSEFEADETQLAFLCEQELRNLKMRLIHTFVVSRRNPKRYSRYLVKASARILVCLSDAVRCAGVELPKNFGARLPILAESFGTDGSALVDLLRIKRMGEQPEPRQAQDLHERLLVLLDGAIRWHEQKWPE